METCSKSIFASSARTRMRTSSLLSSRSPCSAHNASADSSPRWDGASCWMTHPLSQRVMSQRWLFRIQVMHACSPPSWETTLSVPSRASTVLDRAEGLVVPLQPTS